MKRCALLFVGILTYTTHADLAPLLGPVKVGFLDTMVTQSTAFGMSWVSNSMTNKKGAAPFAALLGAMTHYGLGYIYGHGDAAGERIIEPWSYIACVIGDITISAIPGQDVSPILPWEEASPQSDVDTLSRRLYNMLDAKHHSYITHPSAGLYQMASDYMDTYTQLQKIHNQLEATRANIDHLEQNPAFQECVPANATLEEVTHLTDAYNAVQQELREKRKEVVQLDSRLQELKKNHKELQNLVQCNSEEEVYDFALCYVRYYDACKRLQAYNKEIAEYNTYRLLPWVAGALYMCKAAGIVHGAAT